MRIITLLSLCASAATVLIGITNADAAPYIIDVDGSVESMAALATLVQHPDSAGSIALVSVTGTAWGTLTIAENNVRAFLKLAGRTDIAVGVGTSSTIGDTPNAAAVEASTDAAGGSCDDAKLFPPTPAMAAARGLWRSRYDEDDLYGAADALPTPANYGTKSKDVTSQMSSIYNQLPSGTDRVQYIATAGLTNLGRFIVNGNTNAVNTMIMRTDIHMYENGNNFCLDSSAAEAVMAKQELGLSATLYTPTMLAPIKFTQSSWDSYRLSAKSSGVKAPIAWLFTALQGRKNALDYSAGATADTYYNVDGSMGAAFVVMAAVDSKVKDAGKGFLLATNENRKHVQYYRTVQVDRPGLGSLTLGGNNVTRGAYLSLIPLPAAAPSGGVIVITDPATKVSTGASISVADTFWTQWRSVIMQA